VINIGDKIDGYAIIEDIGAGAFGRTYKAEKGGQFYAIKILKEDAIQSEIDFKRFQRECKALQKVDSTFVVKFHDQGVMLKNNIQNFYLVMEYLEGKNLAKVLSEGQLDEVMIKDITNQILSGLLNLKKANIVHRDIKPENIFLTSQGRIKLLDFGLVKMLDYSSITLTGEAVGTLSYMPPEEIEGKAVDHRSDLYSLGVVLFHMLTGRYPIESAARNLMTMALAILRNPPERPSKFNSRISNAFENILMRLLEKEPFQRFSDMKELMGIISATPIFAQEFMEMVGEDRSFKEKKFFVRLLQNEKTELETFLTTNTLDGVDFQANYLPRSRSVLGSLKAKGVPFFFDPSTNRLTFSKFSETKSLTALPYVYDKKSRLTPKRLQSIGDLQRYAKDVLEWQLKYDASYLVAPFHFSENLKSEWLQIDLKLLEESKEYLAGKRIEKPLFCGICTNIEDLTDEDNRNSLVNLYSRSTADGYIFYVDMIDERTTNPIQLHSYISLLLAFKVLKRPIIAGRVGSLGLGLISLGVDGFTNGISSLRSFSAKMLLEERGKGYDMEKKYYVPQLFQYLKIGVARRLFQSYEFQKLKCSCEYCSGSSLTSLDKVAKLHFLKIRTDEVARINSMVGKERVRDFVKRAGEAFELNRKVENAIGKLPPYYHLKVWSEEVFASFLR
jgi:serine/threonine protein kinase